MEAIAPRPAPVWTIATRLVAWLTVLGIVLIATIVFSASHGPAQVPYSSTSAVLLERVGINVGSPTEAERRIIEQIRLPRILTAVLVGAALAVSGACLQAVFRNPLADPGIVGVSGGAALAAVLVLAFAKTTSLFTLPAAAFAGALIALGAVAALSTLGGHVSPPTLVLAGLAVQAFCSAGISAIVTTTADPELLRSMLFWLTGGLDARSWLHVQVAAIFVIPGVLALSVLGRDLNVLVHGEETAHGLGVSVTRIRVVTLVLAGLVTAAAVSVSGTIAFVGLLVPHSLRLLVGSDNRLLIPASALGGAILVTLADTVGRLLFQPVEIRVGVLIALAGAPFFLFLPWRNRSRIGLW